jgi:hypothetical protein
LRSGGGHDELFLVLEPTGCSIDAAQITCRVCARAPVKGFSHNPAPPPTPPTPPQQRQQLLGHPADGGHPALLPQQVLARGCSEGFVPSTSHHVCPPHPPPTCQSRVGSPSSCVRQASSSGQLPPQHNRVKGLSRAAAARHRHCPHPPPTTIETCDCDCHPEGGGSPSSSSQFSAFSSARRLGCRPLFFIELHIIK